MEQNLNQEVNCHWCGKIDEAGNMYYFTGDHLDTMCEDCAEEQEQID